jgi:hypothetical protein
MTSENNSPNEKPVLLSLFCTCGQEKPTMIPKVDNDSLLTGYICSECSRTLEIGNNLLPADIISSCISQTVKTIMDLTAPIKKAEPSSFTQDVQKIYNEAVECYHGIPNHYGDHIEALKYLQEAVRRAIESGDDDFGYPPDASLLSFAGMLRLLFFAFELKFAEDNLGVEDLFRGANNLNKLNLKMLKEKCEALSAANEEFLKHQFCECDLPLTFEGKNGETYCDDCKKPIKNLE